MAHFKPTSFFIATVYKWQVKGQKRVRDATNGTSYLLNTNSLDGIQSHTSVTGANSSMYYFDNPFDSRCNSNYMETDHTVAQLKTHMDTDMTHTHLALNVYPKNDPTESTESQTYFLWQIAYACAVPDSYSATQSYVWVREDLGFKVKRLRVNHTIAAILALVA